MHTPGDMQAFNLCIYLCLPYYASTTTCAFFIHPLRTILLIRADNLVCATYITVEVPNDPDYMNMTHTYIYIYIYTYIRSSRRIQMYITLLYTLFSKNDIGHASIHSDKHT